MPLTDVKVRSLKSSRAQYKVSDGEGLYLLVPLSGAKLWRLAYRFRGKQKALALGKYSHGNRGGRAIIVTRMPGCDSIAREIVAGGWMAKTGTTVYTIRRCVIQGAKRRMVRRLLCDETLQTGQVDECHNGGAVGQLGQGQRNLRPSA